MWVSSTGVSLAKLERVEFDALAAMFGLDGDFVASRGDAVNVCVSRNSFSVHLSVNLCASQALWLRKLGNAEA